MTTGSINYSPDHKSDFESAMDEGRKIADAVIAANKLSAELARLEREVIEAAKAERAAQTVYLSNITFQNVAAYHHAERRRRRAVDALIEFEAQQK